LKIIQALLVALDAMKNDFHTTGKCDLTLARQMEPGTPGTWVLTKNSPYTEYISRGLLLKYFYFYLKKKEKQKKQQKYQFCSTCMLNS
jgi:hypothetical protein